MHASVGWLRPSDHRHAASGAAHGYRGPVTSVRPSVAGDTSQRRLILAFIIALLIHLPFTPLPFIIRLLANAFHPAERWDYQDDSVIIPITLFDDQSAQAPSSAPSDPANSGAGNGSRAREVAEDAGVIDAAPLTDAHDEAGDAALRAAGDSGAALDRDAAPRRHRDAGSAEPLAVRGGDGVDGGDSAGRVKDTMALVGGLSKLVSGKANVSLVLWFAPMREHRLGPLVSGMLACNPQWKDFLGDRVDPLRDLDGLMMFGPRMADSSKVTVLAQSRMTDAKVKEIMSFLAARSQGGFLDSGPGMTAVRFEADRAPRVAFTHPRNMIIITPPEGFEQLRRHREPLSLPKGGGQALSLTMVTPARPLRALRVQLPESLTELRLSLFASADGGIDVHVEFDDADADAAAAHARQITEQAHAALSPMVSNLEFVATGNHLAAETHLSGLLSSLALGFARNSICPAPARDVPR